MEALIEKAHNLMEFFSLLFSFIVLPFWHADMVVTTLPALFH